MKQFPTQHPPSLRRNRSRMLVLPVLLLTLSSAQAAGGAETVPAGGKGEPGRMVLAQGAGQQASTMPGRQQITTVNSDEGRGDAAAGTRSRSASPAESQGSGAAGGRTAADGKAPAGEAQKQLKRFAASTRSASGHFVQTTVSGRGGASSRGRFAFLRPGNFRWEIESPDQQLIVTDGRKLHFYDKDLQQVTVREAGDAIQATPAAVLFGMGDLEESFRLGDLGTRGGVAWIEAVPRTPDSGFERIRVGMRDGKPVAMEVLDGFGQVNRYEFSQLDTKTPVPASQFAFTPPKGVDVLE